MDKFVIRKITRKVGKKYTHKYYLMVYFHEVNLKNYNQIFYLVKF